MKNLIFALTLMVYLSNVLITQKENETTELSLYSSEGKLVFSHKSEVGDSNLHLTQQLSNFSHGRLFFIVGTKNGQTKVEKLLW